MWKKTDDNARTLRISNTAPPEKLTMKKYYIQMVYVFNKTLFFKRRHYIAILKPSTLWIIFDKTSFDRDWIPRDIS